MIVYSKKISLLMCALMLGCLAASSQKPYVLKSQKSTVDGTSTVHDWSSAVTQLDWSGNLAVEGTTVKSIQNVSVSIPVKSIKSEKGEMMDEKTYEAFKEDKNPNVTFKMTNATITGGSVKAFGTLTMAGVSKPVAVNASVRVSPDGSVRIFGSQVIYMSQHGMVPPKAVMGTIKVDDKVSFIFDLTVMPQ